MASLLGDRNRKDLAFFSTDSSKRESVACCCFQQLLVRAWQVLCMALFGSVCPAGHLVQFISPSADLLSMSYATEKTKWDDLSLGLLDLFSWFCHWCCNAYVLLGRQAAETVLPYLGSQMHNHVLDKDKNTKFLHVFLVIFHHKPHQHDKV